MIKYEIVCDDCGIDYSIITSQEDESPNTCAFCGADIINVETVSEIFDEIIS